MNPQHQRKLSVHRMTPPVFLATIAFAAFVLPGCGRPLLAPDEERSQYDRYDAARSQQAEAYTENAFGKREPNLRGRLSPKSE